MSAAEDGLQAVALLAVDGVKEAIAGVLTDADPVVVVTVAWHALSGNPYVIGTAVPDGGHPLLADSLRQSATEAEEAQQTPSQATSATSDPKETL